MEWGMFCSGMKDDVGKGEIFLFHLRRGESYTGRITTTDGKKHTNKDRKARK